MVDDMPSQKTCIHPHSSPVRQQNQYKIPTGLYSVSVALSDGFIVTLLYMMAVFTEFVLTFPKL